MAPVVMARIAAPFGIKGWVKLQVFTEYADSLDEFPTWFLRDGENWREVEIEDFAVNAKGVVAKLKGCDDRTAAEKLGNPEIAVPRDWLAEEDANEFYWVDLIGSEVVNQAGDRLGKVEALMETGANDVLVVKGEAGEQLIPFVAEVIVEVDREARRVMVAWNGEYQ